MAPSAHARPPATRTPLPATPPPLATPSSRQAASELTAAERAACPARAMACVNVGAKLAWLQHDGVLSYGPVPIATGRPGLETPRGTFTVLRKYVHHVSSYYGQPMPYSVFFTDYGIAFHEGPLDTSSHGCVHLTRTAAPKFYAALAYGDEVVVA